MGFIFNCSFINANCKRFDLEFKNATIDTVALCKYVIPELKTFKLNFGDSLTAREVKEILVKSYPIKLCQRCPLPGKELCNPPIAGQ